VAEAVAAAQSFSPEPLPPSAFAYDPPLAAQVAQLWALLLPMVAHRASVKADSRPWQALSSLAFASRAVDRLWAALLLEVGGDLDKFAAGFRPDRDARPATDDTTTTSTTTSSSSGWGLGTSTGAGAANSQTAFSLLVAFCSILRVVLQALDDAELYDQHKPIPLHQCVRLVRALKVVLFKLVQADPGCLVEPAPPSAAEPCSAATGAGAGTGAGAALSVSIHTGVKSAAPSTTTTTTTNSSALSDRLYLHNAVTTFQAVLSDLYTRWARRPFCRPSTWEVSECESAAIKHALRDQTSSLGAALLRVMPWAVELHERMRLFRGALDAERLAIQGPEDNRVKGFVIKVRRSAILEDGMKALERVGAAGIKARIQVRYINQFGEEEAGIDIGGLFKDFVTDLSQRIFDPSYGLFSLTSQNFLYPNPSARLLYDEQEIEALFAFLGRVLGKAMFENITLQPQFSHFFLAFMNGQYNFANLINDLATLDPELVRNLMFLKNYSGDIADLSLTFSVGDAALGEAREVELMPGGSRLAVSSANRHRYINYMAKYYLHDRLKLQAGAFFHGLYSVVSPGLLGMFCAPELQVLISGSMTGVSLEDLRRNTRYAGGYLPVDGHMRNFWSIVEALSEEDRSKLVKFVTSCERPPSLGFGALQPPFTIQRVDGDDDRLPTASTCFNVLKLPAYSSKARMREKLLLSIRSGAGFDLS